MSVVGFDFGNENCLVAVARKRGINVVLNDESKRETPAIVYFSDKQHFFGTAGAASTMMNPKNSISQIKRLVGRQFSDPELQRDIKPLPYSVTEGSDGYPLIHANYLGEKRAFTPTQVMGMMLSNLKGIAEKNLNAALVDCCIGIPVYFTDLQRRAVLDAMTIAGSHPLHLIHKTTATTLHMVSTRQICPRVSLSISLCIAGFKKGQLKVLSHAFDRSLGGRDFDKVLLNHFAAKFKKEYKIDVSQNAKASFRLRAACEKLKKVLSANPVAPLNIECLMDEKDVRGEIKRDEFEEISVPILELVKRPLEKALDDAGLSIEDVHMVEVVGSGSRVPAIIKILTEFFVSKGCALQCAILSPTFKVREFQVHESLPFSILLAWKGAASDAQNGGAENQQSTIFFPRGNSIASVKALMFYSSGTFSVDVQYSDVSELQAPPKISTYTIDPFQSSKGERAKLKLKVRLNLHGVVAESANLLEEEEVEVPVSKEQSEEAAKMDTENAAGESDVNMQEAKETSDADGADNGVLESADKPVQMETESSKDEAPKKKVKKTNVSLSELVYGALQSVDVQKAVEKEYEIALQDRREAFLVKLQEVEDWLYEDGEDETKGVYVAKLEELEKVGDPVEMRYKESQERGTVIGQLGYCVNNYREAAVSNDPKFDHIDLEEKQKVLNECVGAEAWLREKQQQQEALPTYATPAFLSDDVKSKAKALDKFCRSIMTKLRPATKAETPQSRPADEEKSEPQPEASGEEPMETEKSIQDSV
ncbi:hypothetical protein Bca52824_010913 [Brassica carinata]|uniref:Heat shock 70 kDa protein 14 n=1 Tax=Brassica carinata TaxID=52824 RepID=A0A8X7WG24_BRACI|nr:hypothetical protein Bca52824_010913 [Brassica carinata]